MTAQRKVYSKSEEVEQPKARNVLAVLNAATNAEEIAGAVEFKEERDVGIKVAQSILDRRARLGGFKDLKQVAATPLVGPVRFSQIISALEASTEAGTSYVIEGQITGLAKTDLAKEPLSVHAFINGVALASTNVSAQGKYKLSFQYKEQPATTELRVLPAKVPIRSAQGFSLTKTISPGRYVAKRQSAVVYRAKYDLMVPLRYPELWHVVTRNYHMYGAIYATTFWGACLSPLSRYLLPELSSMKSMHRLSGPAPD